MPFVNDIADDLAWLTPAPIGYVEAGWTAVVADMFADIGRAIRGIPGVAIDVLGVAERDGHLRCDLVLDGIEDASVADAVEAAVDGARRRAETTCLRCGGAGRLRLDRAAWPTTLCDAHACKERSA